MVLQPGWSWSTCIKPVVGGESCQARHVGTILSGSMSAKHDDGTIDTFVAGDVYVIEPGHDGWVEGDTECIALEFNATAAKKLCCKKLTFQALAVFTANAFRRFINEKQFSIYNLIKEEQ